MNLEERLNSLEQAVGGASELDAGAMGRQVSIVVAELSERYQRLLAAAPSALGVVQGTKEHGALLESMSDESWTPETALELVVASAGRMEETGALLEQVHRHEPFIHGQGLDQVEQHDGRLGALRLAHGQFKNEVLAFDSAVEAVLQRYESHVREISAALLRCDAIVRKLENAKKHAGEKT